MCHRVVCHVENRTRSRCHMHNATLTTDDGGPFGHRDPRREPMLRRAHLQKNEWGTAIVSESQQTRRVRQLITVCGSLGECRLSGGGHSVGSDTQPCCISICPERCVEMTLWMDRSRGSLGLSGVRPCQCNPLDRGRYRDRNRYNHRRSRYA